MPPGGSPSQPGKIVEISYHEVNSMLRLSDSPGVNYADSPVLIREGFILFTPFCTPIDSYIQTFYEFPFPPWLQSKMQVNVMNLPLVVRETWGRPLNTTSKLIDILDDSKVHFINNVIYF